MTLKYLIDILDSTGKAYVDSLDRVVSFMIYSKYTFVFKAICILIAIFLFLSTLPLHMPLAIIGLFLKDKEEPKYLGDIFDSTGNAYLDSLDRVLAFMEQSKYSSVFKVIFVLILVLLSISTLPIHVPLAVIGLFMKDQNDISESS